MAYTTIVDATHAHEHLGDSSWAFVDCRFDIRDPGKGAREYRASHLPGAVYADLDHDLSGAVVPRKTGRHPLPDPAALVAVFSRWGIGPGTQVVAYDESSGALAAARLWWLLKWAGHDAAAVLDGGHKAWTDAGYPCRAGDESRAATRFVSAFRDDMAVDAGTVQAARVDAGWIILDVRSADRYRGESESIDPVAGHIPGAVSSPYAAALERGGRFKDTEEIARLYRGAIGREGHRQNDRLLRLGGHRGARRAGMRPSPGSGCLACMPGSWSEWITDPGEARRHLLTGPHHAEAHGVVEGVGLAAEAAELGVQAAEERDHPRAAVQHETLLARVADEVVAVGPAR